MRNLSLFMLMASLGLLPVGGQELKPGEGGNQTFEEKVAAVQQAAERGAVGEAVDLLLALASAEWKRKEVWKTAVRVLGRVHQAGQPQLAERFATTLLAQAGEDPKRKQPVLQALARSGFAERTLQEYEALIKQDPLEPRFRVDLAEALLELGRYEEAVASAEVSLNLKKNFAAGHVTRAKVLLAQGIEEMAAQEAQEAVRLEPNNAAALGVVAQALLRRGKPEEADWFVQQAVQQGPDEVEVLLAAAMAHEVKGETREAQQAWDRYLEADPASERAQRVRRGLLVLGLRKIAEGDFCFPMWSPDGKRIAVSNGGWGGEIVLINADGSEPPVPLTDGGPNKFFPCWSPDGTRVVYNRVEGKDDRGFPAVSRLVVQRAEPGSPPQVVTEELLVAEGPRWHPLRDEILVKGSRRKGDPAAYWLMNADGSNLRQVPLPKEWLPGFPAANWSPDGSRVVAFRATSWEPRAMSIYTVSLPEPLKRVVIFEGQASHYYPCFSPDGTKVVWMSDYRQPARDTRFELLVAEVQEKAPPILLLPIDDACHPTWSPAGDEIAFGRRGGQAGLWAVRLGGKRQIAALELAANLEDGTAFGLKNPVEISANVRSLALQPSQWALHLRVLDAADNTLVEQEKPLTLPPRQTQSVPLEVAPGKRGDFRAVATLKTDYGDVTSTLPFKVRESRQEKLPVAILPLALLSANPKEEGWLASALHEGLEWRLKRLWQLDVLEGERARRRLGLPVRLTGFFMEEGAGRGAPVFSEGSVPPLDRWDGATAAKVAQTFPHSRFVLVGQAQAEGGLQTAEGRWKAEIRVLDVPGQKFEEGRQVTAEGSLAELLSGPGPMAVQVAKALGVELEEGQEKVLNAPPTPNLEAYLAYARGRFLLEGGSLEEAQTALNRAAELDPEFGRAHWALGQLHHQKGRRSELAAELQIAAALAPEDEQVQMALFQGNVLSDWTVQIQKVLALNPYHSYAHFLLAQQYRGRGEGRAMILELEKARQDPYFAEENKTAIEQYLLPAYAQNPDLDPRLQAKVEEEWAGQTVREVLGKLSQLSGMSLVAAGPELAGQVVTAKTQGQTVGAVMKALADSLRAQWTRTGQGYFLVARARE